MGLARSSYRDSCSVCRSILCARAFSRCVDPTYVLVVAEIEHEFALLPTLRIRYKHCLAIYIDNAVAVELQASVWMSIDQASLCRLRTASSLLLKGRTRTATCTLVLSDAVDAAICVSVLRWWRTMVRNSNRLTQPLECIAGQQSPQRWKGQFMQKSFTQVIPDLHRCSQEFCRCQHDTAHG